MSYPQQPGYPGNQQSYYQPQQGGFPPQNGPYGNPPQSQYTPSQGQQYGQGYPPAQSLQGSYGPPPQQYGQQPYGQPPQQYGQQPPQQYGQQRGWASQYYGNIQSPEMLQLQTWFQSVDVDRSGTITAVELARLQIGGRLIGMDAAKKLVKVFDKNYSGGIDFQEFASLHQFIMQMQNAFYTSDTDRSGFLDPREIHTALQSAGFQFSFPTVEAICRKYETPGRGISLDQFFQVCAHLATVRSIFEWNDPSRIGKITLTYDQLAHITVHLLDKPHV